MPGITVALEYEDASGAIEGDITTTTDANGDYAFLAAPYGTIVQGQIYVTIPSGYKATLEDASSTGIVSLIDADGYSPFFPLDLGVDINAGLVSTAAPLAADDAYSVIYNQTLAVSAANGVLANDTDPNNLPLTATLVSGPSDGTLTFHSDGSFTYTPNAGYIGSDSFIYAASDGQYSSDATVSITVDSTLSGQVWLDSDEDGIEDNGEAGMSGITVDLVTPDGDTASSTTTDANGNYQLTVDPTLSSQFQIQVLIPAGYSATIPFASTSGIYSSIDYNGLSEVLTLPASGGISNINAGLCSGAGPLGSISGEVWLDSDDNGLLDNGEVGLQAINVNLLDSNSNVVDSTSTDANGDYSFLGLTPNTPYTVQFVAPNGYVFAPQNAGPPATSSSAGTNGDTATITLAPGQSETWINAGLYGSAPIVYDTDIPMLAENDSYTGIDFTADGYDPNGEPLTPVIVQAPQYGSLTYDTSTGLYDYTVPTGYMGLDSFEFELSNGHAVSAVVNVQVLAYTGILPLGTYDSFPAMVDALYTPTANVPKGDAPDPASVKQGKIKDCWFVAAAAGLAQQNPNQIVNMITYSARTDVYQVTFGQTSVIIAGFEHDGHDYSTANGDWLAGLEKAYGQMVWNQKWVTWGNTPYDYINRANPGNTGIEALTGHATRIFSFWCTQDYRTRIFLNTAFSNNKVVVADTGASSLSDAKLKAMGLWPKHAYTVVNYDATKDQVRLRNAWGKNPLFNNGSGITYLGANTEPSNNGYFWMSLSQFTKAFGKIDYEK